MADAATVSLPNTCGVPEHLSGTVLYRLFLKSSARTACRVTVMTLVMNRNGAIFVLVLSALVILLGSVP